jgi:hypothetical protein
MLIDGYYTYENFIDAATRSLQAVEAALRVRLDAGTRTSLAQLVDQAEKQGLIDESAHDILHTGRILRNQQIHVTTTAVYHPAIAASSGPHTSWWLNYSRTGWRQMDSPEGRADLNAGQRVVLACPQAAPYPSHVAGTSTLSGIDWWSGVEWYVHDSDVDRPWWHG